MKLKDFLSLLTTDCQLILEEESEYLCTTYIGSKTLMHYMDREIVKIHLTEKALTIFLKDELPFK